ncbi:hypothetical protein NQZ68_010244 [Dissostichus eleginoides]|nr:hypothetical protein NQZ68_010244 [Dissostichus eleginoides]
MGWICHTDVAPCRSSSSRPASFRSVPCRAEDWRRGRVVWGWWAGGIASVSRLGFSNILLAYYSLPRNHYGLLTRKMDDHRVSCFCCKTFP